jgi:cytochrome c oxidase cbb3-type subunit 1
MLVGVIIAAQLAGPNSTWAFLAELRPLRPLHTNAVIFAFGGCGPVRHQLLRGAAHLPGALFATSWRLHLLGLAAVIVGAAITLPLGYTSGKEYAELEWPIDILIAVVWVSYAIVFFGTIGTRKVKHIYVANWFFGAFILAVALLHIVNSAEMPVAG